MSGNFYPESIPAPPEHGKLRVLGYTGGVKYRRLGNTGLLVSEIAYGTWLTFGTQVDRAAADRIIRRCLDLGINYFDTADVYAKGGAEEMLGAILPDSVIRQDYVLATKVYFPMGEGVNNRGLSRKHIFDSIHDSLKRLRVEYVDIYYCHRYDENTPLVETIQAMQDLIHAGKILHWGVSEWTSDQIAEAASKCKANGWIPPAVNQPRYSLIHRDVESRILSVCEHHGLGVAVFSPLAEGVLTGKYTTGSTPDGSRGSITSLNMFMRENLQSDEVRRRVAGLKRIADARGLTPAQLAIAMLLQRREVDAVVIGGTSIQHIEENARASGLRLDAATVDEVNEYFPPPAQ